MVVKTLSPSWVVGAITFVLYYFPPPKVRMVRTSEKRTYSAVAAGFRSWRLR